MSTELQKINLVAIKSVQCCKCLKTIGIDYTTRKRIDNIWCVECATEKNRNLNNHINGCRTYFKPWGAKDPKSGSKESSWQCGDSWNGKMLLCPRCSEMSGKVNK